MYTSFPYSYAYSYTSAFYNFFLPVLALIVIIAGGLALYFLFVRKPNHYQGATAKLHDIFTFRTFFTERLLRALYCITVVAIAVYSVMLLFSQFFFALVFFVCGNLIARIVYEYALLLLVLCRNVQEVNRKMGPLPDEPEQPHPPVQGAPAPEQPVTPPQGGATPVAPQPQPPAQEQPQTPPQDGQTL